MVSETTLIDYLLSEETRQKVAYTKLLGIRGFGADGFLLCVCVNPSVHARCTQNNYQFRRITIQLPFSLNS